MYRTLSWRALLLIFTTWWAAGARAQIATPLLFKVRSPNGVVSYLFGSAHYGTGLDQLPASTIALFTQSTAHVYEMNVAREWDLMRRVGREPRLMDELLKLSGRDPTLAGDFTAAEVEHLGALGIPKHVAKQMRDDQCQPFVFRELLFGPSPARSLDAEFQFETIRLGRQFIELETDELRDQARAEATAQGYDHSCHVRDRLRDPARRAAEDQSLRDELAAYKALTPAGLYALPDDDDPDVKIRNGRWMTKLTPLLATTPSFVIVGFYHLAGPHGLISLLKSAGFTVDP